MGCPCENTIPSYNECASSTPVEVTGCVTTPDSSCITYNGDDLPFIDIPEGTNLNDLLLAIDTKMSTITGGEEGADWVTFDTSCLGTVFGEDNTIVTLQAFVETISAQFCTVKDTVEDLEESNTSILTNINSILNPSITGCAYLGSASAYNTYTEAMQVYATKLCDLDSRLSIAGVNWQSCFTGAITPTTLAGAMSLLVSQICSVKAVADSASASASDSFVRTSATDTVSSYLMDKLTFSSCFTTAETAGVAGKKLHVALANNIKAYSFNSGQFDVTTGVPGTCLDNFSVALKPAFITSISGDSVDCDTVSAVFVSSGGDVPETLYGSTTSGCAEFTNCDVIGYLADGLPTGKYVIEVDTTEIANCDRYKLVAETGGSSTSNSCTALGWVGLSSTFTTGGIATNPAVTWSANDGTTNSVTYTSLSSTYPHYRWSPGGNLNFKGSMWTQFSGTAGPGAGHAYHYDIVLGTVSNPCSNPINSQETLVMYKNVEDNAVPGSFIGSISVLLSIDEAGQLKLRVYVNIDDDNHDYDVIIPMSGVTFYF